MEDARFGGISERVEASRIGRARVLRVLGGIRRVEKGAMRWGADVMRNVRQMGHIVKVVSIRV